MATRYLAGFACEKVGKLAAAAVARRWRRVMGVMGDGECKQEACNTLGAWRERWAGWES
jgi:hypothetical protein